MDKKLTREEYNELYAEFEFNEADINHNGIISRKEERYAHKNAKIGSLLMPIAGEKIEDQSKVRILIEFIDDSSINKIAVIGTINS